MIYETRFGDILYYCSDTGKNILSRNLFVNPLYSYWRIITLGTLSNNERLETDGFLLYYTFHTWFCRNSYFAILIGAKISTCKNNAILWKYDIYFNKACSLDYVHFVVFFYCNGMVRRFHV